MKSIFPLFASVAVLFSLTRDADARANSNGGDRHSYFVDVLTYNRAEHPGKTFVEVFVGFPLQQLKFARSASTYRARYQLAVSFQNEKREMVQTAMFVDSIDAEALGSNPSLNLQQLRFPFYVSPGNYAMECKLTDLNTASGYHFSVNATVADYNISALVISDLQLSHAMSRSQENSSLVKNNWRVEPNVLRTFAAEDRHLHIYAEIYNLDFRRDRVNRGFIAAFFIRDETGRDVFSTEQINQKPGPASVITARLPIRDLESGQYKLILSVRDLDTGARVEKSTHFCISNPLAL